MKKKTLKMCLWLIIKPKAHFYILNIYLAVKYPVAFKYSADNTAPPAAPLKVL